MQFTKEISNKIKILSFIMTCAIVIFHSPKFPSDLAVNSSDAFINNLLIQIIAYGEVTAMSYFFSVTGFLLFNNLTLKTYKKKIKSRVFTILIPYVLWQIIFVLIMMITGQFSNSLWWIVETTFLGNPIDFPLWYLYIIFFLALLSPILLLVFKKKKTGFICILLLYLFSLLIISVKEFPIQIIQKVLYYGYIRNILYYSPAYLLGAFYGRFHEEIKGKEYLFYMLVFVLVGIVFYNIYPETPIICQILPLICIFELPIKKNYKDSPIFKLTFLMYAIHGPFLLAIGEMLFLVLSKLNLPSTICTVLLILISLVLVILIAWIVYFVLDKFSKKTLELLTGGRK